MARTNQTSQGTEDRPVLIDGRTGRVIEQDRPTDRDTGRGQERPERGTAQWIHGEDGRPTPYWPNSEF